MPITPGSWGALGAVLAAPWLFLPFSLPVRALILLGILATGIWAAQRVEQLLGRKDPDCVVVDELCGQWLTILPFAVLSPWHLLAGFVLFRCFDAFKPWPARTAEKKLPGGLGVMLDDCVAALYASLVLWLLLKVFPY
jgi:phosphatidylglycerophosphatase A